MKLSAGAGRQLNLDTADLLFRTLFCIGTGQRPAPDRQLIWQRLLEINRQDKFVSDYVDFPFEQAAGAWATQVSGPPAKVTSRISKR